MIKLLSKEYVEASTEEIMDWLSFYNNDAERINGENMLDDSERELVISSNPEKRSKDYDLFNSSSNVLWFRRWNQHEYERHVIDANDHISVATKSKLTSFLIRESGTLSNYLFSKVHPSKWVDSPRLSSLNKLTVLEKAVKHGLRIPETLVTGSKSRLLQFLEEHKQVITKPLSEVDIFEIEDHNYFFDTRLVTVEDVQKYQHEHFYLSLFQEAIIKKYELRIFWLNGAFYPMAIFSQRREESKYDFRVYDFEKPDRTVPYKLTSDVESKLTALVQDVGFQHCSIDCIVTNTHQVVFLEINPVGQFGMVSKPCNYYLEKRIAQYLIIKDQTNAKQ